MSTEAAGPEGLDAAAPLMVLGGGAGMDSSILGSETTEAVSASTSDCSGGEGGLRVGGAV